MYKTKESIILASGSPRRRELLARLGIDFTIVASDIDEDGDLDSDPGLSVQEWSRRKCMAVAERIGEKEHWYLGMDTIVVLEDRVMGKPAEEAQATEYLSTLSGNWHTVYTGYCLYNPDKEVKVQRVVSSEVKIKQLSEEEIDAYVKTGEASDKAGAYAIQGIGAFMVEEIRGSYTNVVGLPLTELLEDFLRMKIIEVGGGL